MNTIPLSSIDDSSRARVDYGDLTGLRDSLQRLGSLHPIVLSRNSDNTYKLLYGGRRFRCFQQMGVIELHHNQILQPGIYSYLYRDEVPEHIQKEAELDENLYRLATKWSEDVLLIADVHSAKRAALGTGDWGTRQTAALLGKGYDRNKVSWSVRVAKLIRGGDKEILACENMSDALALLWKRREDDALAELHRRSMPAGTIGNVIVPNEKLIGATASFLDNFSIDFVPKKGGDTIEKPSTGSIPMAQPTSNPSAAQINVPLSRLFQNADFRDCPPLLIDHIVTDIPYGIDMNNLDEKQIASVKAEHDVDENIDLMEPFLYWAYMSVKPSGFCVFFYDLDHHEKLQSWAEAVGWKVQRWPFIACKTSACRNQAAQYNTTKNYEVAMFLRKDEKTVLREAVNTSWKTYDFAVERSIYENPFAKPFELWKDIYKAISFPGQSVCDPFCGEMSACRAAANCGLTPFGIEKNVNHYNRGLQHMRAVYALIHASNVVFT